jgi:hypothetical protein
MHSARIAPFPCPVTSPNGGTPTGEKRGGSYYGNGELWTALWPEGSVVFRPGGPGTIGADGSLEMKWPWWAAVPGRLTIEGGRLDGPAPPLGSLVPDGYGFPGFWATALRFPTEGCWEVTGRAGDTAITFVVRAVGAVAEPTPTLAAGAPSLSKEELIRTAESLG